MCICNYVLYSEHEEGSGKTKCNGNIKCLTVESPS